MNADIKSLDVVLNLSRPTSRRNSKNGKPPATSPSIVRPSRPPPEAFFAEDQERGNQRPIRFLEVMTELMERIRGIRALILHDYLRICKLFIRYLR